MNRGEPVVHDVDLVDARIMDETSEVDWPRVKESEASTFGLALGLWRDQVHVYEKRRVAWGTATGGVISMSVLACVCLLVGASSKFTLAVIVSSQVIRALVLFWKARQSEKDVKVMEDQALDVARQLAELHPAPKQANG